MRRLISGKRRAPGQATPPTRVSSKSKATRLAKARPPRVSRWSPEGRCGSRSAGGTSYVRMARCDQRAVRNGRRIVRIGTVLTTCPRPPSDLGALAVRRANDGLDAAAHPEVAHDLDPARRRRRHEVVEDAVRHVLVEGALVAIGPDVELDALELHQTLVRDVAHADGREVGLARLGAETGELGDLEGDLVVAIRMRIGHHLQLAAREARHGASLLPCRPGWTRPPHRVARPLKRN